MVVLVGMLDGDAATLLDFVVAVDLDVLQNAVDIDNQRRTRMNLQLLDFLLQFLNKLMSTVKQVAK